MSFAAPHSHGEFICNLGPALDTKTSGRCIPRQLCGLPGLWCGRWVTTVGVLAFSFGRVLVAEDWLRLRPSRTGRSLPLTCATACPSSTPLGICASISTSTSPFTVPSGGLAASLAPFALQFSLMLVLVEVDRLPWHLCAGGLRWRPQGSLPAALAAPCTPPGLRPAIGGPARGLLGAPGLPKPLRACGAGRQPACRRCPPVAAVRPGRSVTSSACSCCTTCSPTSPTVGAMLGVRHGTGRRRQGATPPASLSCPRMQFPAVHVGLVLAGATTCAPAALVRCSCCLERLRRCPGAGCLLGSVCWVPSARSSGLASCSRTWWAAGRGSLPDHRREPRYWWPPAGASCGSSSALAQSRVRTCPWRQKPLGGSPRSGTAAPAPLGVGAM